MHVQNFHDKIFFQDLFARPPDMSSPSCPHSAGRGLMRNGRGSGQLPGTAGIGTAGEAGSSCPILCAMTMNTAITAMNRAVPT